MPGEGPPDINGLLVAWCKGDEEADRFAGFEAQSLNVHVDFPLSQRMALPVMAGKTKIAGIKIHDTRMMRTEN
jgi:hypothetical protein